VIKLAGSLDANVVVRLLTGDIPELQKAAEILVSNGGNFLLSDVCLIEVIYALNQYYKIPRQELKKNILDLRNNPNIFYNHALYEETLVLYVNHEALSIEDCYMAAKAHTDQALPLWTFDKKLASQASGQAKLVSQQ